MLLKQPRLNIILIGFAFCFPPAFATHGDVFSREPLAKCADQIGLVIIIFRFRKFFHCRMDHRMSLMQQKMLDAPVKSPESRHAREGGHPEPLVIIRFPPSRE